MKIRSLSVVNNASGSSTRVPSHLYILRFACIRIIIYTRGCASRRKLVTELKQNACTEWSLLWNKNHCFSGNTHFSQCFRPK